MNNKITIYPGNTPQTFFLQKGFYQRKTSVSPIHKHYYTEIHIVSRGKIEYSAGQKTYTAEAGSLIAFPPNMLHACTSTSDDAEHCSVLIDTYADKVICARMSLQTINDFFEEASKAENDGNYSKVSGYLALIYSYLFTNDRISADRIEDYFFIIEEYLKINYSGDIKLSDLAAELNLSEKHTERLIKKYTGNTFKQELASIRIEIAKMLIASTDMTMTEISEYVGYNSYSGFYKAYKKHL